MHKYFTVAKHIKELQQNLEGLKRAAKKSNKAAGARHFAGAKVHGQISRALKQNSPAPMTHLKRVTNMGPGKGIGTFATSPKEIDTILHHVWDPITDGNHHDLRAAAQAFLDKYAQHMVTLPQFHVELLSVDDFMKTCQASQRSAAGLDGWTAGDLALLSRYAFSVLVKLLNSIEQGEVDWPVHMLETRAVFLSEDPNDSSNPLASRILKITSAIYRRWGSTRLRNLAEWVNSWDHPALHAGIPGKGAQDAWLKTALGVELAKVFGLEVSGGSVDIYKCFDQINRNLVYELARKAEMPLPILRAHFCYVDNLQVRYQVANTIGEPHWERSSIPQGCPFSMAMVALITVWVNLMEEHHIEPRCLADDLLFMAAGTAHRAHTINAMKINQVFFEDRCTRRHK